MQNIRHRIIEAIENVIEYIINTLINKTEQRRGSDSAPAPLHQQDIYVSSCGSYCYAYFESIF
jgi:hypothetical protein